MFNFHKFVIFIASLNLEEKIATKLFSQIGKYSTQNILILIIDIFVSKQWPESIHVSVFWIICTYF